MYTLEIPAQEFVGVNNDFFRSICQFDGFRTEEEFNVFCKIVLQAWNDFHEGESGGTGRFSDYLTAIEAEKEMTIMTPWGGVYITQHEPPRIEKYLVIKAGHYLSFEKHELKDEHITVEEGEGLLLQRAGDFIRVRRLFPGVEAHFAPGEEHCLIAFQNLLVFENSLDYKGMDKDLIFIYHPHQD